MTTTDKNAEIARFMTSEPEVLEMDLKKAGTLQSMQYHCDWGWIMECVEKIEDLEYGRFQVDILQEGCKIKDRCRDLINKTVGNLPVGTTKIEAVHNAVYQFVVWYQKQKQS